LVKIAPLPINKTTTKRKTLSKILCPLAACQKLRQQKVEINEYKKGMLCANRRKCQRMVVRTKQQHPPPIETNHDALRFTPLVTFSSFSSRD
jgi:hypothetical protein